MKMQRVGLYAAMAVGLIAAGCSDSTAPDSDLAWGTYEGSATVVDRGNTFANQPFEASLAQSGSALSGSVTVGLSVWNVRGTPQPNGSTVLELELSSVGGTPSGSYVQPLAYVFAGVLQATTLAEGGVEAVSGSFTGPDGFGGSMTAEFVGARR